MDVMGEPRIFHCPFTIAKRTLYEACLDESGSKQIDSSQ